jgi:23S rRNA pseudouridine2605 synthase
MAQGRVRVNGKVVTTLGTRVDPARDVIELDGRRVRAAPFRWILLHKPAGTLTSRRDVRGRRTVYDLLPAELHGLRYLGRLDRDTEGLLLFTNQGDAGNELMHPSAEIEREYEVGVAGFPTEDVLRRLKRGVVLEDGVARASAVRRVGRQPDGAVIALVLLEGRKREVRRLVEAVGHPVRWLRRIRFGPQTLGTLPAGAWRDLKPREVAALLAVLQ